MDIDPISIRNSVIVAVAIIAFPFLMRRFRMWRVRRLLRLRGYRKFGSVLNLYADIRYGYSVMRVAAFLMAAMIIVSGVLTKSAPNTAIGVAGLTVALGLLAYLSAIFYKNIRYLFKMRELVEAGYFSVGYILFNVAKLIVTFSVMVGLVLLVMQFITIPTGEEGTALSDRQIKDGLILIGLGTSSENNPILPYVQICVFVAEQILSGLLFDVLEVYNINFNHILNLSEADVAINPEILVLPPLIILLRLAATATIGVLIAIIVTRIRHREKKKTDVAEFIKLLQLERYMRLPDALKSNRLPARARPGSAGRSLGS